MRVRNSVSQLAAVEPIRSTRLSKQSAAGRTFDLFERGQAILFDERQENRITQACARHQANGAILGDPSDVRGNIQGA